MTDTRTLLVVIDGTVAEAIVVPADAAIALDGKSASWGKSTFPALLGLTFPEQAGAGIGWIVEAGALVPPPAAPRTGDELVRYANMRQWLTAAGGVTVTIKGEAIPFATDEASLTALDRKAMRLAQPNAPAEVNWRSGATTFVAIAADDFAHAATLVDDFVQATFDALPAVFAAIASGTIKDLAAIDAAIWPANAATIS